MAKPGPKIKEIDYQVFESLCRLQCTLEEIASFFKVSEDTIERRVKSHYRFGFADAFKQYSAGGKISLRRAQFRMAETNVGMAIWLGKQYLGQTEKIEAAIEELPPFIVRGPQPSITVPAQVVSPENGLAP